MSNAALSFFEKLKKLAQESDEFKEELDDSSLIIAQMVVEDVDYKFWVKIGDGIVDFGEGEIENPTFTMSATQEVMNGMRTGEVEGTSAYMSGDLKIEGNLQDAIAYGEIISVASDILEDMEKDNPEIFEGLNRDRRSIVNKEVNKNVQVFIRERFLNIIDGVF